MPTIDLSTPPPPPDGTLDALPRRVGADPPRAAAGGRGRRRRAAAVRRRPTRSEAPALEDRLGQSRGTVEDQAYLAVLDSLHDPSASLARRGLLVDGAVDEGLLGAVGLLATPQLALDIDVVADHGAGQGLAPAGRRGGRDAVHGRRHRLRAGLVPDRLVAEPSWAGSRCSPRTSACASRRCPPRSTSPTSWPTRPPRRCAARAPTWSPVLAARHAGEVLDADGAPLDRGRGGRRRWPRSAPRPAAGCGCWSPTSPARTTTVVGVVSWVLLADGWRALHPAPRRRRRAGRRTHGRAGRSRRRSRPGARGGDPMTERRARAARPQDRAATAWRQPTWPTSTTG